MIVVNDWQYLPKGVKRSDFYARQGGWLPESYQDALTGKSASVSLLKPNPVKNGISTAPFFGEMNLRNRYKRVTKKMIDSGRLPPSAIVQKTATGVSCSFPSLSGGMLEIYCSGKTGDCTAEIAEMLLEANKKSGATCFVNLYPNVCKDFVEEGTNRSINLFGNPIRTVLNLGFPSSGIFTESQLIQGCGASHHQFD